MTRKPYKTTTEASELRLPDIKLKILVDINMAKKPDKATKNTKKEIFICSKINIYLGTD